MPIEIPGRPASARAVFRMPMPMPMLVPMLVLNLLLMLAVVGCTSLQPPAEGMQTTDALRSAEAATAADSARLAAALSQSAGEPQYLRFKADETQLAGVRDDGRFTYLEFASPVTGEVEFFDQDGRQLLVASAGRVAAVNGLHQGILVRRAERASFVSPNPRALSLPRRPLPDGVDYGEARAKLENQGGQLQAMQRAMEAARAGTAVGSGSPRPLSAQPLSAGTAVPTTPTVQTTSAVPTTPAVLPALQPAAHSSVAAAAVFPGAPQTYPAQVHPLDPGQFSRLRQSPQSPQSPQSAQPSRSLQVDLPPSVLVPLAAANASASAPERGLVRVFFATASRAIVAPDDGLGLLLREAGRADEIRVTGFTDATGSRATNEALALARADAVVQILMRRGIAADRIFSSAVGADEYIADNASERGRALNRRVEVLLLRNGVPLAFGVAARALR